MQYIYYTQLHTCTHTHIAIFLSVTDHTKKRGADHKKHFKQKVQVLKVLLSVLILEVAAQVVLLEVFLLLLVEVILLEAPTLLEVSGETGGGGKRTSSSSTTPRSRSCAQSQVTSQLSMRATSSERKTTRTPGTGSSSK